MLVITENREIARCKQIYLLFYSHWDKYVSKPFFAQVINLTVLHVSHKFCTTREKNLDLVLNWMVPKLDLYHYILNFDGIKSDINKVQIFCYVKKANFTWWPALLSDFIVILTYQSYLNHFNPAEVYFRDL